VNPEVLFLLNNSFNLIPMSETRNLMVAGSPGVGKTALLLTLARGIFPADQERKEEENIDCRK
jgi:GTPase SAR1 family protein